MSAFDVTTPAVRWGEDMLVISGEAAPKVRSRVVWRYSVNSRARNFTGFDYAVVVLYLLCMIGVGVWFAFRNKSTDDFFRGGKHIPWWVAGCSIYATMLSSLTFIGLPGKTFAQDWAYFSGALMIVAVSPIAVYGALPFFRKIDATSAYEYLEKRFNRTVRLFGSACFTVFHLFRMAIVMSLTALALAICTPMDPVQSVLLMGVLSIAYCAMGGIEAVVWTGRGLPFWTCLRSRLKFVKRGLPYSTNFRAQVLPTNTISSFICNAPKQLTRQWTGEPIFGNHSGKPKTSCGNWSCRR